MLTLNDGSPWLLLVCLLLFIGVVLGLYTEAGSGISNHPYTSPHDGGELASDLPPESLGRAAVEPILWRHATPVAREQPPAREL
jgi:hypothetical protein